MLFGLWFHQQLPQPTEEDLAVGLPKVDSGAGRDDPQPLVDPAENMSLCFRNFSASERDREKWQSAAVIALTQTAQNQQVVRDDLCVSV